MRAVLKVFLATGLLLVIFTLPATTTQSIEGIASWYGGGEKLCKYTANGEVFNPTALTCASWDFSFDTRLKVTNLANQKTVIVKVNDRGPAKRLGRAIDLTKSAFAKIADTKKGLIPVKIEKIISK
ncbi:septal ring lytic transglycosylase RlpA family protein [Candidatus Omnitrophota bacterium]